MPTANPGDSNESRHILRLLWPMWGTQLLQMGHGLVDTLMAGHYGTHAMAAVAIGSGLWLPVLLFMQGVLLASLPLFSQARGQQYWPALSQILQQSLLIAWGLALLIAGLLYLLPLSFHLLGIKADMIADVRLYLRGILPGVPAVASFMVLRAYSEAQGQVLPITLISATTLAVNIPLNHIMMQGWHQIPAMGGAGCGFATASVYWLGLLLLLLWISIAPSYQHCRWYAADWRPDWRRLQQIIRLGLPLGAALFFEVSAFALIAVILAPLGASTVAGHQITLSIASFLFMLPLALSNALTIRTSHYLGSNNHSGLPHFLRIAFKLSLTIAAANAVLVILLRPWAPQWYTADPQVIALAQRLLLYTAAFQLFDGLQVCTTGVLRGLHDTKGPFWITLLAYWGLTLPLGYILGLTRLSGSQHGAEGLWFALVFGLITAALLLGLRLSSKIRQLPL